MLSYELCKKLKEVGWPQGEKWVYHPHHLDDGSYCKDGYCKVSVRPQVGIPRDPICPTLLELIEACGDDFISLEKLYPPDEAGMWWAKSNKIVECIGSTPEQAVANLWLSLPRIQEDGNGVTYWNGKITGKLNKKFISCTER